MCVCVALPGVQVSDEFVLHVPEEYDYRLLGPRKSECIEAIQRAHVALCHTRFVVHESTQILLKSVCSTKPMMKEKRKVRVYVAFIHILCVSCQCDV